MFAPSQRFVTQLTPVTMFLLMISFSDGNPTKFEVVFSPEVTQYSVAEPFHNYSLLGLRYIYERTAISNDLSLSVPVPGNFRFDSTAVVGSSENHAFCDRSHRASISSINFPVYEWFAEKSIGAMVYNGFDDNGGDRYRPRVKGSRLSRLRMKIRSICGLGTAVEVGAAAHSFAQEVRRSRFVSLHSTITVVSEQSVGTRTGTSSDRVAERKLLIYQRNANRRFENIDERLEHLVVEFNRRASLLPPMAGAPVTTVWEIYVLRHDDSIHPCEMVALFQQVDLLLTTHGFQEISM